MTQQNENLPRVTNPRSPRARSFWNFPFFNLPNWGNDLEEEWNIISQPQNLSLYEDDKNIYVEAALPGLNSKEIEISMDQGILRINGERKEEETSNKKFHCKALSSYSYRVTLPKQIDEKSDPIATYKDGILKLTFTKITQAQTKKISIRNGE